MEAPPTSDIEIVRHVWIELADGARLGARLWLPEGAADDPVPAILEYIPYRKDDGTFARDATLHPHLAVHGYACVRVDMRGSGSSDGVLTDEYSEQEMADGEAVIEWVARQPWCDGSVGMIGISWGGITGLQMASRQASALRAVVALGATDSRYYDDGGYYLGCMIGETVGWAALMLGYNTRPPDPEHVGDAWRDLWMRRLAEAPMFLGMWLEHQREDDYWMRGTVSADYDAIQVPVFAVSGHADCWPNTVPRLLECLTGPRLGLQGAWSHRYPQMAIPGPAIDFIPEVVRWFDHWLKGADTDLDDIAMYRVFLQDSVRPATFHAERTGQWLGFETWPSPSIRLEPWRLDQDIVSAPSATTALVSVSSPQTVGLDGGEYMPWFNFGPGPELAGDQQLEDSGSACFDSTPLAAPLAIVGNPELRVSVRCDAPQALLAARLCDVAPDGASTLITRGILNLSQRGSKASPEPVTPGRDVAVDIELDHVGYRVPEGHRLRLALSTSYWPIAWPAPTQTTVTIDPTQSTLELPIWDGTGSGPVEFAPAPAQVDSPLEVLRPHDEVRSRSVDSETGEHELQIRTDSGRTRNPESGLETDSDALQRYVVHPDDPTTARAEYAWRWRYTRDDWDVETTARTSIWCTASTFEVEAEVTGIEAGREPYRRHWRESYPRDHF